MTTAVGVLEGELLRYKAIKSAPSPSAVHHRMSSVTASLRLRPGKDSPSSLADYRLALLYLTAYLHALGQYPSDACKATLFRWASILSHCFHLIKTVSRRAIPDSKPQEMGKGSQVRPSVWPCWLQVLE